MMTVMMMMMMMLKSKIVLSNDIWSSRAFKNLQIVDIIIQSCPLLCHKYNPVVFLYPFLLYCTLTVSRISFFFGSIHNQ
jgi:hypothetical protein